MTANCANSASRSDPETRPNPWIAGKGHNTRPTFPPN